MTQTASTRLRAARAVQAGRAGKSSPSDIAYAVYVGVLVALIVGVPVVRAIVLGLTTASARTVLFASSTPVIVAALAGALFIAVLLAGRTRGPVVSDPFRAWMSTAVDIPGRITLRGSFVRSATGAALALVAIAAVTGLGLWIGGGVSGVAVLGFVAAVLLYAVVIAAAWLAGQALSSRTLWTAACGIAVLLPVSLVLPAVLPFTPWGWVGALWPVHAGAASAQPFLVPLIALTVAATLCALLVPRLLDRIAPAMALWQATRWQAAVTLARTGDASATLGALQGTRARGRGIHLTLSGRFPSPWLIRDAGVALRRPARSVAGFIALVIAGALMSLGAQGGADGTATALGGALLLFFATSAFCEGLRAAADAAGRAPLFGVAVRTDAALHAVFPLVVTGIGATFGALVALPLGGTTATLGWTIAVAVCIVIIRAMDAAKGPLPIELLMPVPTPMGDVSVVIVLLWQGDSLLLSLIVAGGLSVALPAWGLGAWVALGLAAAVALLMADHRFAKASEPQGADID